jgi:hypothetical protein
MDAHCGVEVVEQLYASALASLQAGAKIRNFAPTLALRKVRRALREASRNRSPRTPPE